MAGTPHDILALAENAARDAHDAFRDMRDLPDEQRLERLGEARWKLLAAVDVIEKGLALAATLERIARDAF